jgi:hypothetical protein
MTGLPASPTLNWNQDGCPTLAASLFLRLGWDGIELPLQFESTREARA